MAITYEWRGAFDNAAVNALHAEACDHRVLDTDNWRSQVQDHSLGWLSAHEGAERKRNSFPAALVGCTGTAWLVTATVAPETVRSGRPPGRPCEDKYCGCEWLHVDFDDHLRTFYFEACGLTPTNAGLIAL